jgi:3-deoxy-D-manno-octulosonic-acid transferase
VTGARRGVPLILVNGRVSERSFGRWRRLPGTIAALLRCFDLCLAQSAADADRIRELGAPHVTMTGNLKLDVPEPPAEPRSLMALKTAIGERAVIAGASTHPGEETVLIEAHRRLRGSFARLLTIVAPRHPDRGPGILEIAHAADLKARLRSRGELPEPDTDIYVADTLGELGLIYRLAPIVFVGGSLAGLGGQNPIEPIKLGAAILHGPNVWNFAEIYDALDKSHGAEQVTDAGKLAVRFGALLKDATARAAVVASGRETVATLGGALERTLAALDPYLMQLRLERRESDA